MGGIFGGGGTQKVRQTNNPWGPIQRSLLDVRDMGEDLLQNGDFYDRRATGPATIRAENGILAHARNNGVTKDAIGELASFMNAGPYSGVRNVRKNVLDTVLPEVAGMFGQGLSNSTMASQAAGRAAATALAPFEMEQYNRGRQQQLQGIQLAPMVSNMKYADLGAQQQIGAIRDDRKENFLNRDLNSLRNATDIFTTLGGVGGSQTSRQGSSPLDTIGQIGNIGTNAFLAYTLLCDERVKTDIERVGTWRGVAIFAFRYFFDKVGTRRFGPIAQQVPERARVELPNGLLAVDMGAI